MKVIDLLNKLANGEEVPKKIIVLDTEFYYDEDNLKYRNIEKTKDDLFEHLDFYKGLALNDEVEIIKNTLEYNKEIKNLQKRIDKAIKYIEPKMICEYIHTDYINNMIKFLKGEKQ